MSPARHASFVVRVVEYPRGRVSGVIERVATGAKEPFTGLEGIGRVIGAMLRDWRLSSTAAGSPDEPAGGPELSRGGSRRSERKHR